MSDDRKNRRGMLLSALITLALLGTSLGLAQPASAESGIRCNGAVLVKNTGDSNWHKISHQPAGAVRSDNGKTGSMTAGYSVRNFYERNRFARYKQECYATHNNFALAKPRRAGQKVYTKTWTMASYGRAYQDCKGRLTAFAGFVTAASGFCDYPVYTSSGKRVKINARTTHH